MLNNSKSNSFTMISVIEKVVFITGGAGVIGLCMVKELLNNGAKGVAVIDISEEAGKSAIDEISKIFGDGKAIFIKTDITIKQELEDAFETTVRNFGQLDIVINNAGIVDEFDWKQTIAVNLTAVIEGTYLAMQKYLPQYKSGEEGVIINNASIGGFMVTPTFPVYFTTKHGLIGLGRALGLEKFYEKYKVRVLTLCPGVVDTPLFNNSFDDTKSLFPLTNEELLAYGFTKQKPEKVGKALIEVIARGNSGSLWVVEDDQPVYEIVVPNYKTMKV